MRGSAISAVLLLHCTVQAGLTINRLGLCARARATACSSRAANVLKYSQKIYFMSLYISGMGNTNGVWVGIISPGRNHK